MRIHTLSITVLCALICSGVTHAQSPAQAEPVDSAQIWAGNLGFDPVGAGDLVYISVAGSPELSRSYRVSADGRLTLPLLKNSVPVAGMRPAEIAQAVAVELAGERILVSPIVSAAVLEYRSRLVSVVGAVKAPTTLQALGDMKLLDAIARAQGIAPEAGPDIIVSRPRGSGDERETLDVPIKTLLAGNDPALNIPLHGGEEIRVPEAPKLYVVGNVKMPGTYPLTEPDGSSVLKALALSQGAQSFTSKKAYVYRVVPGVKDRQEIPVDLNGILHRKSPDVALQANDILYIPENSKLRLSASVLDHLSGFGASTASGLIIWH